MKKIFVLAGCALLITALQAQQPKPKAKAPAKKPAATKPQPQKQKPTAAPKVLANVEYTTPSGLKYTITELGKGQRVNSGDKVIAHYTGKLTDGKVFDSSKNRGEPFRFTVGKGEVIKGWDEGFALLRVGDKAVLTIPSQLGYGEQGAGGVIPPNATLTFEVEVLGVEPARAQWPVKSDTLTTKSGLKYVVIEKTSNPNAAQAMPGKNVKLHYSGFFKNGKLFDSSVDRNYPIELELGSGQVIPGWEEAVGLMKAGDKIKAIIPPNLAYGKDGWGNGIIPPNATLIFDMELLEVKDPIKPWVLTNTDTITTESGLKYIVVERNPDTSVARAESGKSVRVHYSGFLLDGRLFDSSKKRNEPISFTLGKGMVIKGWDEGISLMRVGDKLRLIIPPQLGYGESGRGGIPPNATMIFDVELVSVQ